MAIDQTKLKNILEAVLLVSGKPQSVTQLLAIFDGDADAPDRKAVQAALQQLSADFEGRGIELQEVASGFRIQARQELEPWVSRLFQEKAPRYSRALLETLALIAYRQPVTRSEIEEVRGVSVSSYIMKTLQEREWVKVVGHKEVPGRPAMFATTKEFLDYFNLKGLEQLPTLQELKDLDKLGSSLNLPSMEGEAGQAGADQTDKAEGGEDAPAEGEDAPAAPDSVTEDAPQTAADGPPAETAQEPAAGGDDEEESPLHGDAPYQPPGLLH
ncbi:SMC-Scp complex subunit ScpB [Granulosicoccaceae sp. 1_MG-2023]|nr:SMC-Scp complex subunit ScpB [Granulosicoccaceae sp. 1_MG-2023]